MQQVRTARRGTHPSTHPRLGACPRNAPEPTLSLLQGAQAEHQHRDHCPGCVSVFLLDLCAESSLCLC